MGSRRAVERIETNPQVGMTLDECIEHNYRLVHSVCQKYKLKCQQLGIDYEDMANEGFIGLMKGYNKFDPASFQTGLDGKGVKFSTYAVPMIEGEIQRFFRDFNPGAKFSRSDKEYGNKIAAVNRKEQGFIRLPVEEIAERLEMTEDHVRRGLAYLKNRGADSIHEIVFHNDGDPITLEDQMSIEQDYSKVSADEFLSLLDPRDRKMVELRMLDRTQSEIGAVLGISQVQVSRLMKKMEVVAKEWMDGKPVGELKKQIEAAREEAELELKKGNRGPKPRGDAELAHKLLAEGVSAAQIEKETGVSRKTVGRWKKSEGTAIKKKNKKGAGGTKPVKGDIELAKKLLAETDLSTAQIVEQTGCFKRRVTELATEIRKDTTPKESGAWKCAECDCAEKPKGTRQPTLCKACLGKRMSAGRRAVDIVCKTEGCGETFQAKSNNAKWCPACKIKREQAFIDQYKKHEKPKEKPVTQAEVVEVPAATVETRVTAREFEVTMKGKVQGIDGLMGEFAKLIEMVNTHGADNLKFAIIVQGTEKSA